MRSLIQSARRLFHRPAQSAERLEAVLLTLPQVSAPVTNHFGPGVYMREVFMPAGSVAIGHEHKTTHFNFVLCGKAEVVIGDKTEVITGPCVFLSVAGVRKAVHVLEDMRWVTVHATDETDLERLENSLIVKSETYLAHESAQRITS